MNFIPPDRGQRLPEQGPLFPSLNPSQIEMPEDLLWQRIGNTRGRRRQRRQLLATAAVGVFGVALGAALMSPSAPWNSAPQIANQPQVPPMMPAANEAVRAIDRRLQAAYDRNADPAEIRRLWQLRDAVLSQPPASPTDSPDVTVIEL